MLTLISVQTPVLRQQHVKDPSQSAKRARDRLQLNAHAHYIVCGFEQSGTVNWCLGVWCTCHVHREVYVVPAFSKRKEIWIETEIVETSFK